MVGMKQRSTDTWVGRFLKVFERIYCRVSVLWRECINMRQTRGVPVFDTAKDCLSGLKDSPRAALTQNPPV